MKDMMIEIKPAEEEDAKALAQVFNRSFYRDYKKYGELAKEQWDVS